MEIRTLKNKIKNFKKKSDVLHSRVVITEDRNSELKDGSKEFTQFEQQKENKLKIKINRVLGTCVISRLYSKFI